MLIKDNLCTGNTTLVPVKEIVSRARKLCCEELPYLNHHSDIHNAPVKVDFASVNCTALNSASVQNNNLTDLVKLILAHT